MSRIEQIGQNPVEVEYPTSGSQSVTSSSYQSADRKYENKVKNQKNVLSKLALENPNFKLNTYAKVHQVRMNDRLLQSLNRFEIDRAHMIKQK